MKLLITTQVIDVNHPILGFFHRWVEEFATHFERIDVICLEEGEHALPRHVHVHSLGKERGVSKLGYVYNFYRLFWRATRQRPTYVFFHMGAIFTLLAAPFFWLLPHRPPFYWWKTHGQLALKDRLTLWCVDRVYTAAAESFPIATKKRRVVGHAVDAELFVPATGERPIDLLFVGRIARVKQLEQVVEVAARVRVQKPDLSVVFVGAVVDEVYYQELIARVNTAGLAETVRFISPVSQTKLVATYQSAKILMNPSAHNGLDKVVLEAGLCGCVPVSGNTAFQTLLAPHELYISDQSTDGYVACVEHLLDTDAYTRDVLGQTLRTEIAEQHAMHTITERIFSS